MNNIDTLIIARWIIPIEPANTVLENYAVAIDAGRIKALLPAEEARQHYRAKQTYQLDEHVVMPGLINMHTHSPMTLFRGLADDLPLMTWLNDHIWPAEKKWLSPEFCYDGTQLAILEMLRSGTTCFNENFFFGEAIAQAAADMQMRAVINACVIDFPTAYANQPDEYLKKAADICNTWQSHLLIKTAIAPHAPYSVSDDTFKKVRQFVEKYQVPINLHLHETADEIQMSLTQYKMRPLQRIEQLGLASAQLQCVHMTQITAEDILILQKTGAHIVHCPRSNLKLGSGFTPVQQLHQAGINISLGTDGAASNNDLDMFAEMQIAALVAKGLSRDPTAIDAMTALRIATINGARALGLEQEIGSIEKGKAADIIAVDLAAFNTQPIYHPASHLVYALNSRQVSHVWVAGKALLSEGELIFKDQAAIISKAKEWAEKIKQTDSSFNGALV